MPSATWAAIGMHKAQSSPNVLICQQYTYLTYTERREVSATLKKLGLARRSLRWREVARHQFPFPRTSSPAATVDHSKTMRVLMLQEELLQLDQVRP